MRQAEPAAHLRLPWLRGGGFKEALTHPASGFPGLGEDDLVRGPRGDAHRPPAFTCQRDGPLEGSDAVAVAVEEGDGRLHLCHQPGRMPGEDDVLDTPAVRLRAVVEGIEEHGEGAAGEQYPGDGRPEVAEAVDRAAPDVTLAGALHVLLADAAAGADVAAALLEVAEHRQARETDAPEAPGMAARQLQGQQGAHRVTHQVVGLEVVERPFKGVGQAGEGVAGGVGLVPVAGEGRGEGLGLAGELALEGRPGSGARKVAVHQQDARRHEPSPVSVRRSKASFACSWEIRANSARVAQQTRSSESRSSAMVAALFFAISEIQAVTE